MEPKCHICPVPAVVDVSVCESAPLHYCATHVHVAVDDLLETPMRFTVVRR